MKKLLNEQLWDLCGLQDAGFKLEQAKSIASLLWKNSEDESEAAGNF